MDALCCIIAQFITIITCLMQSCTSKAPSTDKCRVRLQPAASEDMQLTQVIVIRCTCITLLDSTKYTMASLVQYRCKILSVWLRLTADSF